MKNLLKIVGLSKNFGGVPAVSNVDLNVKEGKIHCVIGPNGAGKSTFFNLISGEIKPSSGKVFFKDKDITGLPPYKLPHLGISRCFQITNVFPKLTIFENVWSAVFAKSNHGFISFFSKFTSHPDLEKHTHKIIKDVGLDHKTYNRAEELSHGQQRMLEVAITLAASPDLILLDEPTQGLAPEATVEMTMLIKKLAGKYTVLLIEHKINLVMEISDFISVLSFGEIIDEGSPNKIKNSTVVQDAYLGRR
jgi:branched-chain amino acid transport system ATP-binding protein